MQIGLLNEQAFKKDSLEVINHLLNADRQLDLLLQLFQFLEQTDAPEGARIYLRRSHAHVLLDRGHCFRMEVCRA